MMGDRFRFRCWVNDDFVKFTHSFFDEEHEISECSEENCRYYVYSSMLWDGKIAVPIEDVQRASGLNDEDFVYYCEYLDDKINEFDYVFLDGIMEQCTGRTDRNGKLIYEGDILEGGGCRYVVKWSYYLHGFYCYDNNEACFSLNNLLAKNSVIIGNIHQTKVQTKVLTEDKNMSNKKYELTNETKIVGEHTLHRIKALKNFDNIYAGDLGGWVESEDNLSHECYCWVAGNAMVYGNAKVYGNARIFCDAQVYDNAKIYGNAYVYDNARVHGDAEVYDNASILGNVDVDNAKIYGNASFKDSGVIYGCSIF